MNIWHIGDTHTFHKDLTIPENIDMIIFSGDCSNPKDIYKNEREVRDFLTWFSNLNIKYKIFVAGNHDSSIERGLVDKEDFNNLDIIYLENDSIEIGGLIVWGSPYTPTYGDWSFMKSRHTIIDIWKEIPDNSDIIITHGPPKGILDLAYNYNNKLEYCGCNSLLNRCLQINPKLVCFGHIHDNDNNINSGTRTINGYNTIYSNGSICIDNQFGKKFNQGNIIKL